MVYSTHTNYTRCQNTWRIRLVIFCLLVLMLQMFLNQLIVNGEGGITSSSDFVWDLDDDSSFSEASLGIRSACSVVYLFWLSNDITLHLYIILSCNCKEIISHVKLGKKPTTDSWMRKSWFMTMIIFSNLTLCSCAFPP